MGQWYRVPVIDRVSKKELIFLNVWDFVLVLPDLAETLRAETRLKPKAVPDIFHTLAETLRAETRLKLYLFWYIYFHIFE